MADQLWFSPAASKSVSSGPHIATKESNSWVRENLLEDRRKLQRFPNSAALRGLPLVEDARHGKAVPSQARASGRCGEGCAHSPGACPRPGLRRPVPATNHSPSVSCRVEVLRSWPEKRSGEAVPSTRGSLVQVSMAGVMSLHSLCCVDVVTGHPLPLFHVQFPHWP